MYSARCPIIHATLIIRDTCYINTNINETLTNIWHDIVETFLSGDGADLTYFYFRI